MDFSFAHCDCVSIRLQQDWPVSSFVGISFCSQIPVCYILLILSFLDEISKKYFLRPTFFAAENFESKFKTLKASFKTLKVCFKTLKVCFRCKKSVSDVTFLRLKHLFCIWNTFFASETYFQCFETCFQSFKTCFQSSQR